ncbi:MAG: PAS domain-containing sensor histidine kinase [Anaerolineae bacterium]
MTEKALRESEQRFELAVNNIPSGFVLYDAQRRIQFVNRQGLKFTGLTEQEMMGRRDDELFPYEVYSTYVPTLERAIATHSPQSVEATIALPTGVYTLSTVYVPLLDEQGHIQQILGTMTDITDRKRAEKQSTALAAASAALAGSLEYDHTLETVARLAIPFFADYCTLLMLEADRLRQVAHAHRDPAVERFMEQALSAERPLVAEMDDALRDVLQTGEPALIRHFRELVLANLPADENMRQALERLNPHTVILAPLAVHGQILGAMVFGLSQPGRSFIAADLVFAQEVANRAAMAIETARLYREANTAIRLRDQFITMASHELRTPLTSMLGYAELLDRHAREASYDDRARSMIDTIRRQTVRLTRMITTLLDVSHIDKGQLTIERRPFDLESLIERVIVETRPTLRRHTLELTGDVKGIIIDGDEIRLEQVLQNLIQNAVKYSPAGGPVSIRVERDEHTVQISVADKGIGIPAAAQSHLFERFYRASNAEIFRIDGLGMGLYVVQEIVQKHDGQIEVSSQEGRGSTFTVCLPIAPPGMEHPAESAE